MPPVHLDSDLLKALRVLFKLPRVASGTCPIDKRPSANQDATGCILNLFPNDRFVAQVKTPPVAS